MNTFRYNTVRLISILLLSLISNMCLGQLHNDDDSNFPNCNTIISKEGVVYSMSTNIDEMLIDYSKNSDGFEQMYCHAKQIGDIKMEALSLYKLAKFLSIRGDIYSSKKILVFLERSVSLSEANNFLEIYLVAKEVQSTVFANYRLLDIAESYSNEFLVAAEKLKDSSRIAEGFMLLGRVAREQQEFNKSENYLNKALVYANGSSYLSRRTLSFTYLHLSYLRRYQKKYKEAIAFAQKGLSVSKGLGYEDFFTFTMAIAITLNKIDLGLNENTAILESIRSIGPKYDFLTSEYHYVYAFQLETKGEADKAIESYLKCIAHSSKGMAFSMISNAYQRVVPLLEEKHQASGATLEIVKYSQSIFQEEVLKHRAQNLFRTTYLQLEEEKKRANILSARLSTSKKYNFLAIISIIIFSLLTYVLYSRYKLKNRLNAHITQLNEELNYTVIELSIQSQNLNLTNQKGEKLIKKLHKIIERLNKFNKKVAHDFKVPAVSIVTAGQIIKDSETAKIFPENEEYFINHIVSSSNRLLLMVNKLYDFNQNTLRIVDEFILIDLNKVIEYVRNDLYTNIKETNTQIKYKKLPKILGDKVLLYQLFLNLISNSIKYKKEGFAPIIEISYITDNQHITILVKDNGRGISKENSNNLFNIMERGTNIIGTEGMGIGLATCKEIMEVHLGNIHYTSETGKGTTFYLDFLINKNA